MSSTATKAADARLRKIYKRSLESYRQLIESQGGGCAICGRPFYPNRDKDGRSFRPFQDHFHGCCPRRLKEFCGQCNRGALCFICNKFVVGIIEKQNIPVDKLLAYLTYWEPILRAQGAYDNKPKPAPKRKPKRKRKTKK